MAEEAMVKRTHLLKVLVAPIRPLADIVSELHTLPWDCEHELVTLDSSHVANVLTRFMSGEFSAADVETWADAVEGRADLAFRPAELIDAIFKLANPDIEGPLTLERTAEIREYLDRSY